jgi:phage shock protein PspC (stress-responsive transcriptional regulator)
MIVMAFCFGFVVGVVALYSIAYVIYTRKHKAQKTDGGYGK